MSFAAQYLMMTRRLESWYLWIVVDIVAVWLYMHKGIPFVALLYLIFLFNAIYGLVIWNRSILKDKGLIDDKGELKAEVA
jgi:nicotinamide mononucleotide transporter